VLHKIEQLVACKVAGDMPDPGLLRWMECLPPRVSAYLQRIGLLGMVLAAAGKPLSEHLETFEQTLLASRFGGTPWAKFVEGRLKEIEAERGIHRELIRKINVICPTSPRRLPFPAPKVPENMAGLEWRVLKASEADVTLGAGPGNRTLRAARWEEFPAEHLLDLFGMFFPEPTRDEHLALAYLCQERGLDARAQEHLAAAAGE
jgi:hypothetical protein